MTAHQPTHPPTPTHKQTNATGNRENTIQYHKRKEEHTMRYTSERNIHLNQVIGEDTETYKARLLRWEQEQKTIAQHKADACALIATELYEAAKRTRNTLESVPETNAKRRAWLQGSYQATLRAESTARVHRGMYEEIAKDPLHKEMIWKYWDEEEGEGGGYVVTERK